VPLALLVVLQVLAIIVANLQDALIGKGCGAFAEIFERRGFAEDAEGNPSRLSLSLLRLLRFFRFFRFFRVCAFKIA
jgi:hypothetical protein